MKNNMDYHEAKMKELDEVFTSRPTTATDLIIEIEELKRDLKEAREENLEQARLLGMSAEREAALRADLESAAQTLYELREAHRHEDHEKVYEIWKEFAPRFED